jgi:hypothetical protein
MREFLWLWLLRRTATPLLLAIVLAVPAAHAHHSPARFDQSRTITIDGVVDRYDWANPHVYILIDQITEAGETVTWEIEAQPPAIMRRGGWLPETLSVGDVVSVSGNPGRGDAGRILYLASMQRADDALYDQQRLMAGMSNAGAQPELGASGLDGMWATLLSWAALQPFVHPIEHMQLTDAGAAAVARYDERTMNPALECVPFPAPYLMVATDTKRISTRGGAVIIEGEHDGSVRTVHMDVATHESATPSIHGHSTGRWEDSVLVIDTAHFAPHRVGSGIGLPSGAHKRLVERLTLAKDGKSLTYRYELTDPEFIAAPVIGEVVWAYRPDLEYAPVPCDLEVARRFVEER